MDSKKASPLIVSLKDEKIKMKFHHSMISPVGLLFMPFLFFFAVLKIASKQIIIFLGSPPNILTSTYPGISQGGNFQVA